LRQDYLEGVVYLKNKCVCHSGEGLRISGRREKKQRWICAKPIPREAKKREFSVPNG
jgi:hypothetical protein